MSLIQALKGGADAGGLLADASALCKGMVAVPKLGNSDIQVGVMGWRPSGVTAGAPCHRGPG